MREYETTVIIQPEISDEASEALLGKLDRVLADGDAIRLMAEDLGKRKLAYEINKFQKGHYYILSFLDRGQIVPPLERVLRLEESVLRFMTVQVTDEVRDIEARKTDAAEREVEQQKRAEERAKREAEEAAARAEAERVAAEEAAAAAAAAEAEAAQRAEAGEADGAEEGEAEAADASAGSEGAGDAEAAPDASGDEGEKQ